MKIIELGYVPFRWLRDSTPEEWHTEFQRGDVQEAYRALVRRIVNEPGGVVVGPYLYQREPNLRIHPPGGVSVPWHTDADFGHLSYEQNVWIPLTPIFDNSQRLWVDWDGLAPGPVNVPLGSALVFWGAGLKHGNMENTTDAERRSFDFRLISRCYYRDTGARTVLYDVPLRVPEYWTEMTDD